MLSASPTTTTLLQPERVSWHRYVRLGQVEAYLALGWTVDGKGPLPPPHGCYAVWMDWTGSGEPPEPGK